METFSALLALCAGNSPVTNEFPSQRPVTRSFDVSFDPQLNKQLNKQSWDWWFKTQPRLLWRHCTVVPIICCCDCHTYYECIFMPSGGDGKVYKQNHLVHNMECSCQTGSVSVGQFDEKKNHFFKCCEEKMAITRLILEKSLAIDREPNFG